MSHRTASTAYRQRHRPARREQARERQAARARRSTAEQLALIAGRRGRSERERLRLTVRNSARRWGVA